MKNKTFKALIIVIVVQIVAFVGMVGYSNIAMKMINDTEEYKMKIEPYYVDGKTVYFDIVAKDGTIEYHLLSDFYYTLFEVKDGYAYIYDYTDEKPDTEQYMYLHNERSLQLAEYKINGLDGMNYDSFDNVVIDNAYITFKVHNGNLKVTGMYVGDITIEEWLLEPVTKSTELDDENMLDAIVDEDLLS